MIKWLPFRVLFGGCVAAALADTRTDAQKRKKVFVKATLLIKIMVLLIGSAGIFSEVTNPKQETLDWGEKGGAILRAHKKKDFGAIPFVLVIAVYKKAFLM